MSTAAIPPTSASTTVTTGDVQPAGQQVLNQNDFLKLLVAQMTSQDPLNPQSDTDMAAQMAQFTSLEQTQTMTSDMATLLSGQQLLQANGLLGSTVALQADQSTIVTGVVQAVQIQGGAPQVIVNGTAYDLSQVLSIAPTPAGQTTQ